MEFLDHQDLQETPPLRIPNVPQKRLDIKENAPGPARAAQGKTA
jgi:hypothetical protein